MGRATLTVMFPNTGDMGVGHSFEEDLVECRAVLRFLLTAPYEDVRKACYRAWRQQCRKPADKPLPCRLLERWSTDAPEEEDGIGPPTKGPSTDPKRVASIGTLHHHRAQCQPCAD